MMDKKAKHILFITPSLANTGSEILLFHYITFLSNRYSISVICYKHGSLISLLPQSVKVHVLNLNEPTNIFQQISRRFKFKVSFPFLLNRYKNYTWYINTIVLPFPVKYAIKHNIDFMLHVHELKHMYDLLSKEQLENALNNPILLIANSQITKEHLKNAGSKKDINVITPFIDLPFLKNIKAKENQEIADKFCWVMAGSIDENKNPKLFIEIAKFSASKDLPYKFVWFYNSISDALLFSKVKQELTYLTNIEFVHTDNYNDYITHFSRGDGLLLTSTYESFSMVTLEALALNMAIVVNDCGGVREIIDENTASVVRNNSHLDFYINVMQKEVNRLEETKDLKRNSVTLFDKAVILSKWEKLMLL